MDKPKNPLRRTTLIWAAIIVVGIIIVFIPAMTGMDGPDGGFALGAGGIFVAIFGIVGTFVYARLAIRLDQILKKENQLAHWTYNPEEWETYTEQEHTEDKAAKKGLFIMISVIAIIVGIIFYAVVRDNFLVILSIFLFIILVAGLSAYFSTVAPYRQNRKYLGEVYISQDGVYVNRQAHIWKGIGARLENVVYEDGPQRKNVVYEDGKLPQSRIRFDYSTPGRYSRNDYTARVPVPRGQEEAAKKIVAEIVAAHFGEKQQ